MQLKSKVNYSNRFFSLEPGEETTNRPEITEEQKQYLVDTFPADFEVIATTEKPTNDNTEKPSATKEFNIETPEDKLKIINLESNLKIETKQVGRPKKVK